MPEANWWLQALLAEYVRRAVPPGAYRTSGPGGVNAGMTALTSMDEAFEGAQANGTWTLRVRDICGGGSGRTGRITGAKLRLEHVGSPATPPETPDPPGESLTFDAVRGTLGKIPDPPDDGSESCEVDPGVREVRFRASGLTELEGVEVELALKHPWVSDLEAYLIGPDGTERLLFGGVWSGGIADGTYTFADRARGEPSGGWWQEARVSDWLGRPMASATYRTTAFGDGPLRQSFPAPTSLDEVFVGRPANGTWKLRILDVCPLYAGEVSGARLRLVGPRESVAPKLKLKRPKVNAKRRSVRLAFSASDDTTPQADLAFSCRLDGKRFRPCKSPVTYKRLKPGRHRITVRVSDAAGNRAQASKGFKVPKPKRRR